MAPHESPYPQLDDAILEGFWANANTGQEMSPSLPTYYFTASIDSDPTYAPVLTGNVFSDNASTYVGKFKFSMNTNPDYPNTPDSFTGTFNVGTESMSITGTYAGDQTAYPSSNILAGSDAYPPRPRPIFPPTGTPTPTPQQPKKSVVNLGLHLVHPSARAIKNGKTAIEITIINRGPDTLPVASANVWVYVGPFQRSKNDIVLTDKESWDAGGTSPAFFTVTSPDTGGEIDEITAWLPAMTRRSEVRLYVREKAELPKQYDIADVKIGFSLNSIASVELHGEEVTTSISGSSSR